MRYVGFLILGLAVLLSGCGQTTQENHYRQISQEQAKEMMDTQNVIIRDVREQDEYESGHILGSQLLPVNAITEPTAGAIIPEKDSVVFGILPKRKSQ